MYIDQVAYAELQKKYPTEKVFVIESAAAKAIGDKFTPAKLVELKEINFEGVGRYINRYDAEGNPAFQQLIPYVLIANKEQNKFYACQRIAGDKRLKNKWSIGFGGHINPCDGYVDVIRAGLLRELEEELNLPQYTEPEFVGFIRDISSSTFDHLGFLHVISVSNMAKTSIKEKESLTGEWCTLKDLVNNYHLFEGWSKYVIDYLYSKKNNSR